MKLKDDLHSRNHIKIYTWKTIIIVWLKIKHRAKMWLCEAIYQKRHLEIPTLGIFELP
jgi:hypothetical protein